MKFIFIFNFIFIFPGYITNRLNDQLPVGLLAQLVGALHRYRRGQGSNPGKPDFFRLSFRNCISCVNNCEDLLYIYFIILFLRQFPRFYCLSRSRPHFSIFNRFYLKTEIFVSVWTSCPQVYEGLILVPRRSPPAHSTRLGAKCRDVSVR